MNLYSLSPFQMALISSLFTWGITALGAAIVFFFKDIKNSILNPMLSFAAGVMLAASFWSLLDPAIKLSKELGHISWFLPSIGFLFGGSLIIISDKILNNTFNNIYKNKEHINKTSLKRSILMVFAVALHNFPEGLAIGVAFGIMDLNFDNNTLANAIMLAIGIGLQNFPEGAGVSLPLRREGFSRAKSFFYGQLSGAIEPVAAIIGVTASVYMRNMLPFLLSFSAGTMIAVIASELVPEAFKDNKNLATIGLIAGFLTMMILDVALS